MPGSNIHLENFCAIKDFSLFLQRTLYLSDCGKIFMQNKY